MGTLSYRDTPKYKLPPGFRKAQEVFNLHRAMRSPIRMNWLHMRRSQD